MSKIGKTMFTLLTVLILLNACVKKIENPDKDFLKKEILETESLFMETLRNEGTATAFYDFAADSAVINRGNDSLIIGREAIRNYYNSDFYADAVAEWTPDYVDVSDDGTMAYTFGRYTWTLNDSTGKKTEYSGVFHTVWKRQMDGTWKYVWD